jgi:DnaJ-domain-containing protein 1
MKNPIERIMAKSLQAMLKTLEEELGKLVNQLLQDVISPEMIADMLKKIGSMPGMDFSRLAGMVGQHPGFDAYRILGLDKSASDEEVKKRYHDLVRRLHPDTAGVQGTEFLFQMVMAAYEMIKKERRWQ